MDETPWAFSLALAIGILLAPTTTLALEAPTFCRIHLGQDYVLPEANDILRRKGIEPAKVKTSPRARQLYTTLSILTDFSYTELAVEYYRLIDSRIHAPFITVDDLPPRAVCDGLPFGYLVKGGSRLNFQRAYAIVELSLSDLGVVLTKPVKQLLALELNQYEMPPRRTVFSKIGDVLTLGGASTQRRVDQYFNELSIDQINVISKWLEQEIPELKTIHKKGVGKKRKKKDTSAVVELRANLRESLGNLTRIYLVDYFVKLMDQFYAELKANDALEYAVTEVDFFLAENVGRKGLNEVERIVKSILYGQVYTEVISSTGLYSTHKKWLRSLVKEAANQIIAEEIVEKTQTPSEKSSSPESTQKYQAVQPLTREQRIAQYEKDHQDGLKNEKAQPLNQPLVAPEKEIDLVVPAKPSVSMERLKTAPQGSFNKKLRQIRRGNPKLGDHIEGVIIPRIVQLYESTSGKHRKLSGRVKGRNYIDFHGGGSKTQYRIIYRRVGDTILLERLQKRENVYDHIDRLGH